MFSQQSPTRCSTTHAAPLAATVAPGFQMSIAINNLTEPTSVHFLANGKAFVSEKSGLILEYDSVTDTTPTTFADLRTEVDDFWDRGLLDIAVSPNFPTTPYIFAYFGYDAPIGQTAPKWNDACPTPPGATTDGCVISGRLVRLTADASTGYNTMVAGSETVIIKDQWCQQFPSHSNDTVAFGPDGALYLTAGDGASFNNVDYGQYGGKLRRRSGQSLRRSARRRGSADTPPTAEGGALRAQSFRRASTEPTLLNGAILRIDPTSLTGDGKNRQSQPHQHDINKRRIDAYGLRNPFRFTFRPSATPGALPEVWIGDVGWNTWEEIDRITDPTAASKNFGWPCYEGVGTQSGYQNAGLNLCKSLSGNAVSAPYFTYNHNAHVVSGEACPTGSSAISGLAFYQGNTYPAQYHGALFFSDYSRNCIWAMQLGSNGLPDPSKIRVIVSGAGHPVDLETGPSGDLFYVDLDDGQIRRIQANQPECRRNRRPRPRRSSWSDDPLRWLAVD